MTTLIDDNVQDINHVEFTIFSNDDVQIGSAIKESDGITQHDSFYVTSCNETKKNGVLDARLGAIGKKINCATCYQDVEICPGHFGHAKLNRKIFNFVYLPYIKKILECICFGCKELLAYNSKNKLAMERLKDISSNKARFVEYHNKLLKNVKGCEKCNKPAYKIKMNLKKMKIEMDASSKDNNGKHEKNSKVHKYELSPGFVYDKFKDIPEDQLILIGFDPKTSHPKDMIIEYLAIPPNQIRPSVRGDFAASSTSEDSLTHMINTIIKYNAIIKKESDNVNDGKYSSYPAKTESSMQMQHGEYIDDKAVQMHKTEKVKSISSRIKSKEGRIRGNCMGKRVDFSARTVISPDPSLSIEELCVPLMMAKNLTVPEHVSEENISRMTELIKRGPTEYPGANSYETRATNYKQKVDLKFADKKNIVLMVGDIVNRHIINGEIVLFNRQPSLHKLSMLAHKVFVIEDNALSTFRFNESVTTPYNAD